MALRVAKMHGAGNDFVVAVLDPTSVPDVAALTRRLADRRLGVGADGVLYLERLEASDSAALRMHFYNSDGSRAALCLNGSRCVALRAVQLGWVEEGAPLRIVTDRQDLRATVRPTGDGRRAEVELVLAPPRAVETAVVLPDGVGSLGGRTATMVQTGDPHLVVEVELPIAEAGDFADLARPLRHWTGSSPAGANVHFVHRGGEEWIVRSFERGVEDETLACGSGCVSAVLALGAGEVGRRFALRTRSGAVLTIVPGAETWSLRGPAVTSFETDWIDDD